MDMREIITSRSLFYVDIPTEKDPKDLKTAINVILYTLETSFARKAIKKASDCYVIINEFKSGKREMVMPKVAQRKLPAGFVPGKVEVREASGKVRKMDAMTVREATTEENEFANRAVEMVRVNAEQSKKDKEESGKTSMSRGYGTTHAPEESQKKQKPDMARGDAGVKKGADRSEENYESRVASSERAKNKKRLNKEHTEALDTKKKDILKSSDENDLQRKIVQEQRGGPKGV